MAQVICEVTAEALNTEDSGVGGSQDPGDQEDSDWPPANALGLLI